MLMTKSLATRPGWWSESVPSWNFKGQWLVLPTGERQVVNDPFEAVAAALTTIADAGSPEVRRPSGEAVTEPYPECNARCELAKELVFLTMHQITRSPLIALLQWRKNTDEAVQKTD